MLFLLIDGGIVLLRLATTSASIVLVRSSIAAHLSLTASALLVSTLLLAGAVVGTQGTVYLTLSLIALVWTLVFVALYYPEEQSSKQLLHTQRSTPQRDCVLMSALTLSCMLLLAATQVFRNACIERELRKERSLVGTIIETSQEPAQAMVRAVAAIESSGGDYAPCTLTLILTKPLPIGSRVMLSNYQYHPAVMPGRSGTCFPGLHGVHLISQPTTYSYTARAQRAVADIEQLFSPHARTLFRSLLLGAGQPEGTSESAAWGVGHLLARSGLHLTLGAALFHISTGPFLILTLILLTLYGALTQSSPSFLRAYLLWGTLIIAGPYLGRPLHPTSLTALTASALLITDPTFATTLAWQLSTILAALLLHIHLLFPPRFV